MIGKETHRQLPNWQTGLGIGVICSIGLGYGAESFSVHKSWSRLERSSPWNRSCLKVLSVWPASQLKSTATRPFKQEH